MAIMIVRSADDGLEVLPWHEAVRVHVTEVTALGGGSKLGRSAQRRGHRLGWRAVRIYVVGSTLCARRTSMARRASPVSPLSSIVLHRPHGADIDDEVDNSQRQLAPPKVRLRLRDSHAAGGEAPERPICHW